ncbi:hypothetical protein HN873_053209, partial [Arachis hypogaea]
NEYEHEFIGKIVRVVSRNIRNIASPVVGIQENGGTEAESLLQDNQRNNSKVKAETEANVENFMEVDVFEKSVGVQLESLKRKKRELEGQIRAINDQITEFQRKTVAKRKKAFDSGKKCQVESIVT